MSWLSLLFGGFSEDSIVATCLPQADLNYTANPNLGIEREVTACGQPGSGRG